MTQTISKQNILFHHALWKKTHGANEALLDRSIKMTNPRIHKISICLWPALHFHGHDAENTYDNEVVLQSI